MDKYFDELRLAAERLAAAEAAERERLALARKSLSELRRQVRKLEIAINSPGRFWALVGRTDDDGCWEWKGNKTRAGYGMFSLDGRSVLAHRYAYSLQHGEIPQDGPGYHGWVVMHNCDNPSCVNPAHLALGTNAENAQQMHDRGRRVMPAGESHHNARFTEDDVRRIRNDPRAHSTVAREYQTSAAEIHYIRTQGWSNIPKPDIQYEDGRTLTSRGNANPNSRLTEEIVRAIRASDAKPGVLAKQYGIKPDTVTKIRRRLSWAHVE